MKRLVIFLFLTAGILMGGASENREFLYKKAVSCYAAGNYEKAKDIFLELENSGLVSFSLYYNLGNTYYKSGELGRSIQYWEKAAVIDPSDKDLRVNLELARSRIEDQVVLPEIFFLFKWYGQLEKHLNLKLSLILAGTCLLLVIFILILNMLHSGKKIKCSKAAVIILTFFFVVFSAVTADINGKRISSKEGIVLTGTLDILNEPLDNAPVSFILHEGAKVVIEETIENEWLKISYFDDKSGWVKISYIGEI